MGGIVLGDLEERAGRRGRHGRAVSDLDVTAGPLVGTVVEPDEVPLAIDELPLVALLGCFAEGETVVRGAQELRLKESDRIATVVDGLRGLGGDLEATDDGFVGPRHRRAARRAIASHGDHRLAMLGAVAGLASREGVEVVGMEAAEVSYPRFMDDLATLRDVERADARYLPPAVRARSPPPSARRPPASGERAVLARRALARRPRRAARRRPPMMPRNRRGTFIGDLPRAARAELHPRPGHRAARPSARASPTSRSSSSRSSRATSRRSPRGAQTIEGDLKKPAKLHAAGRQGRDGRPFKTQVPAFIDTDRPHQPARREGRRASTPAARQRPLPAPDAHPRLRADDPVRRPVRLALARRWRPAAAALGSFGRSQARRVQPDQARRA